MTKAQLIEALAALGIEASAKHTVAQLQEMLASAQAAVAAVDAAEEATSQLEETLESAITELEDGEAPEAVDAAVIDMPGVGTTPDPAADAQPAPPAAAPVADVPSPTVLVKVGPRGQAGRIIVGGVAIDGRTPGRISRADFARLRVTYDLREVED